MANRTNPQLQAYVVSGIRRGLRGGAETEGRKPLKIFIGYDPREAIAYHVLCHSILARASGPVSITPIALCNLKGIYTRERHPDQSTDFTFSRFLTPWLSDYEDVSIFMDSDMLCLTDVYELAALASSNRYSDVLVVKHNYRPIAENKFLNQKQTTYPCKNWSSLMVFNGHRMATRRLTPEYVNAASPMDLHQFHWAQDVGEIPAEYNHLVGEYRPNPHAKIVHYTLGSPCFKKYQHCEFAKEWFQELGKMTYCDEGIWLKEPEDGDHDIPERSRTCGARVPEPHRS